MSARVLILLAAVVTLMLAAAAPASALVCDWTATTGGDWRASSANWSCGVIPDGDDDVILDNDPSPVLVTLSSNEQARGITITDFSALRFDAERTLTVGTGGLTAGTATIAGAGTVTVAGPFTHSTGEFTVADDADVVFNGAGTFSGGTLELNDTHNPGEDPSVLFNGALDLSANDPPSDHVVQGTGVTVGSRPFKIGATGSLSRTAAGTATINVPSESAGAITIGGGSVLELGAADELVQTAGSTVVQANGTLDGRITLQGGTLTGAGSVWGAFNTGGTISPDPASTLTIGGMTQTSGQTVIGSGETLHIDVSGAEQSGGGGSVSVASGGTLRVTNGRSWILDAGTLALAGTYAGDMFMNGTGALSGTGTITGKLTNWAGTVAPGASPGKLTIGGDLDVGGGDDPVFAIELAGTGPTEFDQISVGGEADLGGGMVQVTFLNAHTPPGGAVYQFLTAGSRSGSFHALSGAGGLTLQDTGAPAPGVRLVAGPASAPPAPTGQPQVTGAPDPGNTVTCQPGAWTNNPTSFAYAWLLDGQPIAGATSDTYSIASGDAGHQLSCRVTATNAGGSGTATSPAVTVTTPTPNPTPTPTPTPTPMPTPPKPTVEEQLASATLGAVAQAFGLPSARKCLSRRNFVIRLVVPKGVRVKKVRVVVHKKAVKTRIVRGRHTARVDLRGLPKGRFVVKLTVTTVSGKVLRGQRAYRTCAPKGGKA